MEPQAFTLHSVSRQLSRRVGPTLDKAFSEHLGSDEIVWEGALLPSQDQVFYTVFVWMKGAVLGSLVQGSFRIVDPFSLNEKEVDDIVQSFLYELRQARSAQVFQPDIATG